MVLCFHPDNRKKAYLEFFCCPEKFQSLTERLEKDPDVTYYAVTKTGDLVTNNTRPGPNAVTWGVFPGKEIVQPTIVELVSFIAWKDEAFELGHQWAELYKDIAPESARFIHQIMDSWYLVNIVNNDFRKSNDDSEHSALFQFFGPEPVIVDQDNLPSTNGAPHPNGLPKANGSSTPAINEVNGDLKNLAI
jgi:methylenetetrahydrofolate reductase (NADPH)